MSTKKTQIIALYFSVVVIAIASIFWVNGLILAWTAPAAAPPLNNVDSPLNVGSTEQSKSGGLILNTGGSATGLIVDQGNVGIGTANPAVKFHIHEPAANAYQYITAGGANVPIIHLGTDYEGAGVKWGTITLDTAGKLKLLSGGSLGSPGITVDTVGNVGIGTTAPSAKLHVASSGTREGLSSSALFTDTTDTTEGVFIGFNSTSNYGLIAASDLGAAWRNLVLQPIAGNVGIGTAAPTQRLDVAGNITANLMYDRDNTGYYVDPHWISRLNAVYPNSITMYGDLNLNGRRITGGQALDGQVCQIAVYASIQGGGIKWNFAQWIDGSGWQRLGTVGGAVIDSQKIYNIAIKCK